MLYLSSNKINPFWMADLLTNQKEVFQKDWKNDGKQKETAVYDLDD